MSNKKNAFHITGKVKIRIDFADKRAVMSCKAKSGKTIDLEADLETLDKINAEVRRQLDRF
jgi:hypothetical protein